MLKTISEELHGLFPFKSINEVEEIQSLWSGYGSLLRVHLNESPYATVIVKRISPPDEIDHPRGWHSDVSHRRKLHSYEVECNWYRHYAKRTNDCCRVPALINHSRRGNISMLILEDLDYAGYYLRKQSLKTNEIKLCLGWLAEFHAINMMEKAEHLWDIGTYWQLETRLDEFNIMPAGSLKDAAYQIHKLLNSCKYKTFVHGDAKYANFCFAPDGRVAALDFQYIGTGCGMKDVAYLLSCISGGISSQDLEDDLVEHYFKTLKEALKKSDKTVDFSELETEWRKMYPIAWADFERFLAGWAPGHWKTTGYSDSLVRKALAFLGV